MGRWGGREGAHTETTEAETVKIQRLTARETATERRQTERQRETHGDNEGYRENQVSYLSIYRCLPTI